MHVYIPTYDRADLRLQTTWTILNEANVPCSLVVRERQLEAYLETMPSHTEILVIPEGKAFTIADTRYWLFNNTDEDEHIVFDDDLRFFRRPSMDSAKLVKLELSAVHEMVAWMKGVLKVRLDTAQVGISCREGNNHQKEAYAINTRCIRAVALHRKRVIAAAASYRAYADTKEDFDMTLQLLCAGYENVVSFAYAQDQRSSNDPGGCETYRTIEYANRASHRLKELHPDFVTLVEKETKSSWKASKGSDPVKRTDVRIAWKKAYASSLKG